MNNILSLMPYTLCTLIIHCALRIMNYASCIKHYSFHFIHYAKSIITSSFLSGRTNVDNRGTQFKCKLWFLSQLYNNVYKILFWTKEMYKAIIYLSTAVSCVPRRALFKQSNNTSRISTHVSKKFWNWSIQPEQNSGPSKYVSNESMF